jgi:Salmonella virulence plasmid 65kDa B protein/FG-GAP-like repeat
MQKLFFYFLWVMSCLSTTVFAQKPAMTVQDAPEPTGPPKVAVGATQGTINVTALGAATYTIPIDAPNGINGLQPNLGITYNSQTGIGLMGMGWSFVTGVQSISRIGQTPEFDGDIASTNFSERDRLALDGNRMVPMNGTTYWNGTIYRTDKESFVNIYKKTNTDGTIYFELVTKDSTRMLFGEDAASRIDNPETTITNANRTLTWYLTKVIDSYGNTMTYTYLEGENAQEKNLFKIEYANSITIQFGYAPEGSYNKMYVGGLALPKSQTLNAVSIFAKNTNFIKKYKFLYSGINGYGKLTQIWEDAYPCYNCDIVSAFLTDNEPIERKKTFITWGETPQKMLDDATIKTSAAFARPAGASDFYTTVDFNNDGLLDYIRMEKISDVLMCGDLFNAGYDDPQYPNVVNWHPCTGPFDEAESIAAGHNTTLYNNKFKWVLWQNTGNANFVQVGGENIVEGTLCDYYTSYQIQSSKIQRLDYNGDGFDDWVVTSEKLDNGAQGSITGPNPEKHRFIKAKVQVYAGSPTGYTLLADFMHEEDGMRPDNIDQQLQYLVVDLDGDKKQELLIVYPNAKAFLYSYNGTSTPTIQSFTVPFTTSITSDGEYLSTLIALDYNGNGKTDLFVINKQGTNTNYHIIEINSISNTGLLNYRHLASGNDRFNVGDFIFAGDFNGDGKSDLICRQRNDLVSVPNSNEMKRWDIYYSTGAENGQDGFVWATSPLPNTLVPMFYKQYACYEGAINLDIIPADFNSDGRCDILYIDYGTGGQTANFKYYYSRGHNGFIDGPTGSFTCNRSGDSKIRNLFGNFDGDPLLDFIALDGGTQTQINFLQKAGNSNLVTGITNGLNIDGV